MKLIALGSPGVGKGTYAKEIIEKYGILHISTGQLFRDNMAADTELGKKVKAFMDSGNLVPDEVTVAMVKERLKEDDVKKGFIFDGFPRNIAQAESLKEFCEVDMVINFKADQEIIMQRLTGRRTCSKCAATFHVINIPPKVENVCDKCGGELVQRSDEQPEVIEERLRVYEELTAPLIDHYKEKGLLREITINEDMGKYRDIILERIFKVIDGN